MLHVSATRGEGDKQPGKRPHFHRVFFPAWCLQERILLEAFKSFERRFRSCVVELGFTSPGVNSDAVSAFVAIPGTCNVFLDLLGISCIDRMHSAEVAIEHYTTGILKRLRLRVTFGGELAIAKVIR